MRAAVVRGMKSMSRNNWFSISRFKIQDSFIVSRCQEEKKKCFVTFKEGLLFESPLAGASVAKTTQLCCAAMVLVPMLSEGVTAKLFKVVVSDNLHPVMNAEMFPSWCEWCPPGGEWPTIHTARGLTGWFDQYGDGVNYTITISQPSMTPLGDFWTNVFDHSLPYLFISGIIYWKKAVHPFHLRPKHS